MQNEPALAAPPEQVAQQPPENELAPEPQPESGTDEAPAKVPPKPVPAKTAKDSSMTKVVLATLFIVIILAVLAVYAYSKQH